MRTIGKELDESQGVGGGFDFLRVALSIAVITFHTPIIATHDTFDLEHDRFVWLSNYSVLMMFFSLSGFLMTGSALRLNLKNYLINRSLRIVPALAVEICLSALVIGPLFTVLTLSQYFSNVLFFHYFTNIFGWINFHLPGVFAHNPAWQVNLSLWTIPFEIGCYFIMALWMQFGWLRKPWRVVAPAVGFLLAGLIVVAYDKLTGHATKVDGVVFYLFMSRGPRLLIAFCAGVFAYLFRYRIPYSWPFFWACVACYFAVAWFGDSQAPSPVVTTMIVVPLIYMMAFIGVSKVPPLPLFHRGDYSYGIYLYGWPIMQSMRALFPGPGANATALWLISLPVILLFAVFSWHAVEKPVLRVRRRFSFVARQRLAGSPAPVHAEADRPIIAFAGKKPLLDSSTP